ncbi:MAG: Carboxypeptidase regulatory-like domain [Flavipsychrobacter sp.]|jgi:hypothetical protein|nr:Carboxypeptidase regulatory-like domain [Flavipsychrobacter sp.]
MRLFSKIFFALLLFASATYAQDDAVGTVSGKLMGNLQPVAGAEVVILQKDKLFDQTTTDENGNYRFPYLRPGYYDVRATMPGYRTSIIIKIPVAENKTTKNDFYLPKYNNGNMPSYPLVEGYEDNCRNYMRNKTYRTKKQRRLAKYE